MKRGDIAVVTALRSALADHMKNLVAGRPLAAALTLAHAERVATAAAAEDSRDPAEQAVVAVKKEPVSPVPQPKGGRPGAVGRGSVHAHRMTRRD